MQDLILNLSSYGYLLLFLYSFGGGMVALIAAGVLCSAGKMDIYVSVLVAGIANFVGDSFLFYLSRYNKKEIMPYVKKHRRKLAFAQILVKKYGERIILIKKYIYGVKTLVPLAIGLTKYSFIKFSIINAFSSAIWAISVGFASYYAGEYVGKISSYFDTNIIFVYLFLLIIFASLWFYVKKITVK